MISVEFLFTSLVVVAVPGTGAIYTVSTAVLRGRRASLFASLGCTLGILPHLAATILGLAAVLQSSAQAFQVLIFFVAFLPQFVDPAAGQPMVQLLVMSAAFMAMTLGVFVTSGLVAHGFRRHVMGSDRLRQGLRVGFSAVFVGLGARLALSDH